MDHFASRHVPELDGLRGIAIFSVIIHHQLTPFSLTGGFLGVDLFFVLSGFLITGLLYAEFDNTNSISLKKFYMRRVLRLGPALGLYLLVCLFVAIHTHVISLAQQLKLILIALAYATNWRMAFGWDATLDPTAIIWSLSIEEQFYLVWPLILFAALALNIKRRYIASGLAVVIIGIMVHRYALLNAGTEMTRLYYGTDTRADALLIGCLIASLPVKRLGFRSEWWLKMMGIPVMICLLCLMATVGFTDRILYEGGFTAIALLCGLLIFLSVNFPSKTLSTILSCRPLRWAGRISYGLYLWHWLVVRTTTFYYLGKAEPWARLALALAISSTSYYLLETPFNKLKRRFSASPTTSARAEKRETTPRLRPLVIPLTNEQLEPFP